MSRTDVGRCLAALATGAPTGRSHDLTGPGAPDVATIAAMAARRWENPVRHVDLTPGEYQVELARSGLDPWWCYAFTTMFGSVRQQRWAHVSGEVARLTGQPPRALGELFTG